ncbi:multiple coagulation factor deficiency protein 2 homolog isoform X2 [Scyliorhinus torazame]|uniref:multiple coagulation factor deficiency protein 2 homolog isoform X2 n=1 Tax=Scyliorhinus torazame TaxID=75743 RepID=UPI003B5B26ED
MLCLVALCLFFFSFVHFATCSDSPRRTVPKEGVLVDAFHNRSIITNHHHLEEELKHHLGELDLNEISEQELEFYYFTLHDFDKNMLLDGLEIMTALEDSLEETLAPFSTDDTMKLLIEMTDEVLEKDDVDRDGYLSYSEYMHSQNRTASPTTILDKSAKEKASKQQI